MLTLSLLLLSSTAFGINSFRIRQLPGFPSNLPLPEMYSGSITVNRTSDRKLFFWYVVASPNDRVKPVVFWFNGGPGCSSLGGLLSEHGPFWPNADGSALMMNSDSWNQVAHVVYVDSPAMVGFSTSANPDDANVGDRRTAEDAASFVAEFLSMFKDMVGGRDVYIAGESYGGHYVPNLALELITRNVAGITKVPLKGIFVGNPLTDPASDMAGQAEYWYTHGMINSNTYMAMQRYCNFSTRVIGNSSPLCDEAYQLASQAMQSIYIYDVYTDVCIEANAASTRRGTFHALHAAGLAAARTMMPRHINLKQPPTPPCVEDAVTAYLNRMDVQSAIHAPMVTWQMCTSSINYSENDVASSMLPVYNRLLSLIARFAPNFRIQIYSGDFDGLLPVIGTRNWIDKLNLQSTSAYNPWLLGNQTGGWYQQYGPNFGFASVRGAGHMVPATQPARALELFASFLGNMTPGTW